MPPRPIRPKNEPSSTPGIDDVPEKGKSAKRRAVSSACIPCRKRKSKCDGQMPSCSTCIAVYRTECTYDADSDHRRKGALKRDIRSLQQQNSALDVIVASLKSLPENDSIALLHSLRGDANPDELAESLRSNVRLPASFAPQTLEADLAQSVTTQPSVANTYDNLAYRPVQPLSRHSSESSSYEPNTPSTISSEQPGSWFRTPQDPEFVEHLLDLYRCWVHPFYAFVSWDHFVHDMGRGKTDFCSAMLVNAILAFACHYSDRSQARVDPTDSGTAGDRYYAEAKRLLDMTETPSLTAVQALGIMGLRETSAGRDSNGYQLAGRCVRMALEMGLHLSVIKNGMRSPEAEVRKVSFWAVFNMETLCAVGFGRLSGLPCSAADIETPSTNARAETRSWRPYIDINVSLSPSAEQPARVRSFKEQLSKLSELASDMVNTFYAPRERFTSRTLAAKYAQYQSWYQNLPDVFRLENTSLPYVLVLHMYYYGCVLHLFRPYIKLDLQAANLYPRDTCTFCANEISSLMNALRAMYGLRRVTLAVVNLVLSASTIHLLNLPSESAAAHLTQGLHDLDAMSVNHRFAARAVDIIRSLSSKWSIALPESAAAFAYSRLEHPRDVKSPPPSTFFAASIPRTESTDGSGTDGRNRSGDSIHSHSSAGPFSPPVGSSQAQQQMHQQPTSAPTFYSDPTIQLDPTQAQTAFWTPFPTQVMPIPHSADFDASTMMDLTSPLQMDGIQQPQQQWQQLFGGTGTPSEIHCSQQPAPGKLSDGAMSNLDEWQWSE
ncbi:Nitrogen assimilation transcription factor nit-4 [Lecanosticta acicola]|uniref:Nitrogen assimilation transcription factor nit-4 n=1 Tax=Lecanosticta acicola TaxID=111012 RepID=A0AAI8Z7P1_9PEZI|nr:Nitrogen assimilation transcription factor nit-4 [Lecanosticta acicola]